MDFALGVNSVVAHASGRVVGTDQAGLCHFQLPHCLGRLAVRLVSVPLPVSTNAMDRAREAGRPAGSLLVVRLGRNAGCHLVLDITFPPLRMIAPLAKFIDWSVLQMANVIAPLRHAPRPKWKLEEALEFLNGPDFFPAASDPVRIEFDGPRRFKFPTPRPSEVAENNIVYGRLYRCAERWQERPVIILLDGEPPAGYHAAFPLIARRFNRAGFNVATLVVGGIRPHGGVQ